MKINNAFSWTATIDGLGSIARNGQMVKALEQGKNINAVLYDFLTENFDADADENINTSVPQTRISATGRQLCLRNVIILFTKYATLKSGLSKPRLSNIVRSGEIISQSRLSLN